MELVYSTSRHGKCKWEWVRDEWPVCSLSSKNVIAFTATQDLAGKVSGGATPPGGAGSRDSITSGIGDSAQDVLETVAEMSGRQPKGPLEVEHHVFVADIDRPWDVFSVTSYLEPVTHLEWDPAGTSLLLTSNTGHCRIWTMKDHLLNEWTCTYSANMDKEDIVAISWLHRGIRVNFHADKKDSVLYTEKMIRSKFMPSLSRFGGKPANGWVAVTSTGMVSVGLLEDDGDKVSVLTESLDPWRTRVVIGDITHDGSGDILIAASDGTLASAIQCYRVSLKADQDSFSIACHSFASLYAKCHTDPVLRESPTSRVTHLKYVSTESGRVLIVGAGDSNISHVELWNLVEQVVNLHRIYQSADSTYTTAKWVHKSSISHGSIPISIAVPRFPVVYPVPETSATMFQYVAIAYRDGSVKLVNRSTFQPMTTTNLDTGISETDRGEKRRKMVPYMVHMQQTFTGCGLIGFDQYGCLYVMKAVNTRDPVTHILPEYLVAMLEYVISLGHDWWDILSAIRPGMIESVIQRLSDNFVKQLPATQDLLYPRLMAVKSALFRCSSGGQQRAADCHCRLLLHCIATAFKSVFQPKAMSAQEKSPAEKLALMCSKNLDSDLDKVVASQGPDKKDFQTDRATLQALQPLTQWVADLSLYLLASLPMFQGYGSFPGCSLVHDISALSSLRELLAVIRIWGAMNPSSHPHFTTMSSNFDCLAQLFKLLTKVWLMCKEGPGMDFDEGLLDECCVLPSQVVVPQVDEGLFGNTNYEASIFQQSHPIKFTFGEVPSGANKVTSSTLLPECQVPSLQRKDIVRQIHLGVSPADVVKQCSRCSCVSLTSGVSLVPALKAWDLHWAKSCICGGHWKSVMPQTS